MTDPFPRADLVPYADALRTILETVQPLEPETLPVDQAIGRFLREPAKARSHSPRFEQSAMDGFAVRIEDIATARLNRPVALDLTGEIPAGSAKRIRLKPGQTVKVFTGSRLPGDADTVVMKEFVRLKNDRATIRWNAKAGDHIRRVGEEYRRGDVIMPEGIRVTPPVVGMLVTLGRKSVRVGSLPAVTVITMGDELVAPGEKTGPGQIHDSNGPATVAALRCLGITKVRHRRVPDDPRALKRVLRAALKGSDLVITVGGASVGDHDHVHDAREALGVREIFTKLAIKPGKPNLFGLGPDGTPVFGLPGNPVSALVSFHQLVKPAVFRLMGAPGFEPRFHTARLTRDTHKKPGRLSWLRGTVATGDENDHRNVNLLAGQGSHMLSGLALADVLVELSQDLESAAAGDVVPALPLDWWE